MRGEHSGRAVTGKRKERWTERKYERERERKGGMKENMNGKIMEGWSEREYEREHNGRME